MGDETEFQKAYQDHRDEKQEARRLQGLVATLTGARAREDADIAEEIRDIKAAHVEEVANADEMLKRELARMEEQSKVVAKDIAEAEAALEAIRKRTSKRTESLFSLLNDDLRQQ